MTSVLQPVRWRVGDPLPPLTVAPVSRTVLALFAGGSGDHNPVHLDVEVARTAGHEDVFAQGMLCAAFLGRLLTDTFPQAQLRSLSTRFVAITPVGARPTCQAEVVEVVGDLLTLALRVVLGDGTTTLTGQAVVDLSGTSSEGRHA